MNALKNIIQRFLGLSFVRKTTQIISLGISTVFSFSYIVSVPFHWVSFINFMREQRAVLDGKRRYNRNLGEKRSSRVELRRNIHRLEKGLLMRPRRSIFAREYIMETIESFADAVNQLKSDSTTIDKDEVIWAHNVLQKYFDVTDHQGTIMKAFLSFQNLDFQPQRLNNIPYKRIRNSSLPTYEELLNLSMYRRSVRWFLQKPVPRELIDKALLIARQSPTACNRLPYEFKIFDDPDLVRKVASTPVGTSGYDRNIPVIAVLVGKLECYFSARDRHAIYVDTSLAAMSFAFAAETLGLSTCMINWPDFEPLEQKMQKLLKLKFSERPIMLMAIGYPDPEGYVAFSQKKSLENIRSYNFEDA